jgi:Ca2+-binding EF-hand superfamily protein
MSSDAVTQASIRWRIDINGGCLLCYMQALVDAQATERLVANLRKRINGSIADMRAVFESFDNAGSGVLPAKAFTAACAALGVVLSPQEQAWVKRACTDATGSVSWHAFCGAFADA